MRRRLKWFDRVREAKGLWAGFVNFNLDFWLTIPPMVISLSLDLEGNLQYFGGLLLLALSLIALSLAIDGKKNAIVVPFWSGQGNPRLAYNMIENKKIIHIIKGEDKSPSNYLINFQFITNQRSLLLVATVVSILAVDFPAIFSRRFCKTEEFGISLVTSP